MKSVEFGGGGPKVFSVALQIGAKLSDDEFNSQLTPVLIRLFSRQDRAMRVCLLENMHLVVDRLSSKTINDKIFPSLVGAAFPHHRWSTNHNQATGFSDQAPLLRELTVKSILTLVSKLSDRTVNGELLKHLAKTANDPEPGIRTNTTICLGKIAKNMSATVCMQPHLRANLLMRYYRHVPKYSSQRSAAHCVIHSCMLEMQRYWL